ncbi:HAD-IIIC family phosphatase [Bacillus swezeyi]|uniref:HAD-IIIC family phosphatase n=1 Tax=Bacillus swezeyi TaxID=1925020 RepID=A0A5M8RGD5_9BACI|nr:HAD-IIIC family phosphatase [Bacillus swezeyi]KAA6447675.1 HAD-IIIC family phosphatase [Bacillus swezeyi]TYS34258.1 HAD-IIIC family phosphatase [Bacillus swezeyi]
MKKNVKCVVWDLDHTLWEGILLESDDVKLKDSVKKILTELDERGILLSIASRNDEQTVLKKLKEFEIDHFFLYPEINWNAKSVSLDNISKNLNINKDTLLFIDDQAFEREEVQNAHPDIICWEAERYQELIENPLLKPVFITEDAKRRRQMYLDAERRKKDEESFQGPSDEFLASLDMRFTVTNAQESDLQRAEELTVRTNQLNASGKTYDYQELDFFRLSDSHLLLVCELEDKYGSYGKIGLSLIEEKDDEWHIKLLLMSCRVMSRGVGTILLTAILKEAKNRGKKLFADFKQTDRNRMMYITYKFANFKEVTADADGYILFENDLTRIQPYPPYVDVKSEIGTGTAAQKSS